MTDADWFTAMVAQAPDAMIVADRAGRIRQWNPAAERLFGHAAADVIGQGLELIIPERLRSAHQQGFDHAIGTGRMKYDGRAMTTRSMHRDGTTLYVDMSFALMTDAQGVVQGALAIARDVTSRHQAERSMRERIAALEQRLADGRNPGQVAPGS